MPEIYRDVTIPTERELQPNRDEKLEFRALLTRIMKAPNDEGAAELKEITKARYGGHFADFLMWIRTSYGRYEYYSYVQERAIREDTELLLKTAKEILDDPSFSAEQNDLLLKLKKLVAQLKAYPLNEFSRADLHDHIARLRPNNDIDRR